MEGSSRKPSIRRVVIERIVIIISLVTLTYLLLSLYFINHYFFNTIINGINVSLKSHKAAKFSIINSLNDYKLELIDCSGNMEVIYGQEIGVQYNDNNRMSKIFSLQNSLLWAKSTIQPRRYNVRDLIIYNNQKLNQKIKDLKLLNQAMTEPRDVSFRYRNGTYVIVKEEHGNKIVEEKLTEAIKTHIQQGRYKLDLVSMLCYEQPKYTAASLKTPQTHEVLKQYISTNITYLFGDDKVVLDGRIINRWLRVDDNLEVKINETAIMLYVKGLCAKYDTIGTTRQIKTSTGKIVEVTGGLYGWKIDQKAEIDAIKQSIHKGESTTREPIYEQRAVFHGDNEIGDTYVEINITKQYLWYYKKGKLLAQGPVVTGNPNRGNATVLGIYMLNYKQKDTIISGPGYEAKVTYWMPFFGNIGLHDASWRYSFGGEIYKRRGSHGCVNAPVPLAKRIFENIDEGTPIICYEE